MVKKIIGITALLVLSGLLIFGAIYRTQAKLGENEPGGSGSLDRDNYLGPSGDQPGGASRGSPENEHGQGGVGSGAHATHEPLPVSSGALTNEESSALLYLWEEERLAQQVYAIFYDQWDLPVFLNISQSEAAHAQAIQALLERSGVSVPDDASPAVFSSPDLQALYTALIEEGSQSLGDALHAAAGLEEQDMLDLQERLAGTQNAALQQTYTNLLDGSSAHLRTFAAMFERETGETYEPQFLSLEAYQAIYTESDTRGGNGRGGGRGGRP